MLLIKLINSYLSKRRKRIKINDSYSLCPEMRFGVPQGSILCPLLFIYSYVTFLCSGLKMVLLITLKIIPHNQQLTD